MPSENEIRQQISEQILNALKVGVKPWRRPWALDPSCGAPKNAVTQRPYRGINVLLLELASMKKNYACRFWATFQQIKQMKAHVRRGETATHIILFKPVVKTKIDDDGEEIEETFPVMRTFCVFNAQQTVGLEHLWPGRTALSPGEIQERFEHADAVVAATGVEIRHGGNEAFYSRSGDYIQMPHRHQFTAPDYYATLLHELVHATEAAHRLNWDRANEGYAMGELIAELGGCFLAGELGIPTPNDSISNHASYLQHWLEGLQNDTRFIFRAAAQANRAADYVLSFSTVQQADEALVE
jgi:antirestriction protein ArdC